MKSTLLLTKVIVITLLFSVSSLMSTAATFAVDVSSFAITPSDITVEVGDTVVWTISGSNHNVNGSSATFASNANDFFSGTPGAVSSYTFIFIASGSNDYQCDNHVGSMQGTVTVNSPAGIAVANDGSGSITTNGNRIVISGAPNTTVSIYSITGQRIHHGKTNGGNYSATVSSNGIFIVRLSNAQGVTTKKVHLP